MSDDPKELRLQEIFADVVALPAPGQAAYLDRVCQDEPGLRSQVELLLNAHHAAGGFLSESAVPMDTVLPQPADLIGTRIGRYTLVAILGEGGFATVYRAEQQEPVRRTVALKIIKLGMDTRQVLARFDAERQALAILDHPNITKVFDAGITDTGRPYFVMELVDGSTITEHCDRHNLSPRERLELFVPVCQAVQHAHQKGIIHRDLKPTNVLVKMKDGEPVPTIIDFGIAKAVQLRGPIDQTQFTEFRQLIGTPAYMSPEQAGLGETDIDTRSDVYSLGVMLYELLTGTTPIENKALRAAAYEQIHQMIREFVPPMPSTRIALLGEGITPVAAARSVEPRTLGRKVRGEIDWIVMRCLQKDRARRYQSAGALSDDIQRHLTGDEVLARAPSRIYRLKKFARRYAIGIATGLLLLAVLIGTLGMTLAALARESKARELAERANADALGAIRASLHWQGPDRPTVLLRENYERVRAGYGDDHQVTIKAAFNLAAALVQDKHYDESEAILLKTIDRAKQVCGPHSMELLAAVQYMIHCLNSQNRCEEAIPFAKQMFEIIDSEEMGVDQARYYADWWGGQLHLLQRFPEAREAFLGALRILRTRSPEAHTTIRTTLMALAEGAEQLGEDELALQWRLEAYVEAKAAADVARSKAVK